MPSHSAQLLLRWPLLVLATLLALATMAAFLPLGAPAEAQSPNNAPTLANEIPDQTGAYLAHRRLGHDGNHRVDWRCT